MRLRCLKTAIHVPKTHLERRVSQKFGSPPNIVGGGMSKSPPFPASIPDIFVLALATCLLHFTLEAQCPAETCRFTWGPHEDVIALSAPSADQQTDSG